MGSLNKVQLIGRLGQDPEKRVTPQGKSVVNVSLATTENYKDKSGNKQEKTEWHKIQAWDRLAEIFEQYTKKGSLVYVEGSIQTREWKDKEDNKRFTTEIVARSMQMLDSKQSQQQSNQYQDHQAPPSDNFAVDDVPF